MGRTVHRGGPRRIILALFALVLAGSSFAGEGSYGDYVRALSRKRLPDGYEKLKLERSHSSPGQTLAAAGNAAVPRPTTETVIGPIAGYSYRLDADFSYTFYREFTFQAGQHVVFETRRKDDPFASDPVMYLFDAGDPVAGGSWRNDDFDGWQSRIECDIPRTGRYILLLRAFHEALPGTTDLYLNDALYLADVPLAGSELYCGDVAGEGELNYFTAHLTGDTVLWLEDEEGLIRAYNDDYRGTGDFAWGAASRVKRTVRRPIQSVFVSAADAHDPTGRCDVYAKLPNYEVPGIYPFLKADDAIQSGPRTPGGEGAPPTYNCYAWAGGISDRWIDPAFYKGAVVMLDVRDLTNAADWSRRTNLQAGDLQYGDRSYRLTRVPASVAGADWIRTAADSKAYTGTPLVEFAVRADTYVYVAHSDAIRSKPAWLTGWTDSGEDLTNSEATPKTYSLYQKLFPAGSTVSLGANGGTSVANFLVILKEVTPPPADRSNPWYDPSPIVAFDKYFGNNPLRYPGAWTYTREGATEANSVIDLWSWDSSLGPWTEFMHASVRRPGNDHPHGYDWESKNASDERFFHPRYAIRGDLENGDPEVEYGQVVARYRPVEGTIAAAAGATPIGFADAEKAGLVQSEHVVFTDSEEAKLARLEGSIPEAVKEAFEAKHQAWVATWEAEAVKVQSNAKAYARSAEYLEFLRFCRGQGRTVWPLLFQKLKVGARFIHLPILALTLDGREGVMDEIRIDSNQENYTADGRYLAPTAEANMMKYARRLLARIAE